MPAQIITQAGSQRCAEWLINPASSQQKSYHWIGFIIILMMGGKNNVAVLCMSIN